MSGDLGQKGHHEATPALLDLFRSPVGIVVAVVALAVLAALAAFFSRTKPVPSGRSALPDPADHREPGSAATAAWQEPRLAPDDGRDPSERIRELKGMLNDRDDEIRDLKKEIAQLRARLSEAPEAAAAPREPAAAPAPLPAPMAPFVETQIASVASTAAPAPAAPAAPASVSPPPTAVRETPPDLPRLDESLLDPGVRRAVEASRGITQTLDKIRDRLATSPGYETSALAGHIRTARGVWETLYREAMTSARRDASTAAAAPPPDFEGRIAELGPLYCAGIVDGIDHALDPSRSNPDVQSLIHELCDHAGIEPLPTKPGDAFDPDQHHPMRAMGQVAVSTEKYRIGRVIERGFRFVSDGRIARKTKVDLQG
jgi:molecular chaperone GrpE (heat shock protein)